MCQCVRLTSVEPHYYGTRHISSLVEIAIVLLGSQLSNALLCAGKERLVCSHWGFNPELNAKQKVL